MELDPPSRISDTSKQPACTCCRGCKVKCEYPEGSQDCRKCIEVGLSKGSCHSCVSSAQAIRKSQQSKNVVLTHSGANSVEEMRRSTCAKGKEPANETEGDSCHTMIQIMVLIWNVIPQQPVIMRHYHPLLRNHTLSMTLRIYLMIPLCRSLDFWMTMTTWRMRIHWRMTCWPTPSQNLMTITTLTVLMSLNLMPNLFIIFESNSSCLLNNLLPP